MTAAARPDLTSYTIDQLHSEMEGVKRVQLDFKERQAAIDTEIAKRTEALVKGAIEASGKTHGVINAPITNSLTAKIDISKKVDWDSGKLMAVAQTLTWDRVAAIFKIEFSVPGEDLRRFVGGRSRTGQTDRGGAHREIRRPQGHAGHGGGSGLMGIFIDTLDEAMDEAARFIARAKIARRAMHDSGGITDYPSVATAAVRRSSMDLTRSLAKLRSR